MKSAVETLSPTRVRLTVEVPFEELRPSLDAAYRTIASQVTVPGFRRGKVPARIIDQRIGRGAVLEEAVNSALPKAYGQAVEDNGLKVLGQPAVEVTDFGDGQDLTFTAEVDVRPVLELPDFSALAVQVADAEVTDADVDEELEALRTRFGTLKPVDRVAADGDFVSIDLAATHEGEPVEAMSASGMSYQVGSGDLLEGLDEVLIGLGVDQSGAFSTMPSSDTLDADVVEFTVTVRAVRERELPPLDDDFAQTASEFDTLDELRADLRNRIGELKKVQQGFEARDAVLAALLAAVDVPIPEGVVTEEVHDHLHNENREDDDAHRAEVEEQTRESLKQQLVLDAVAEREKLSVSQAELSEFIVRQAPRYGMTAQAFAEAIAQAGQVPMVVSDVLRAKALSVVMEQATVTDASGNPVDLSALTAPIVPEAGTEAPAGDQADAEVESGTAAGAEGEADAAAEPGDPAE